ncbi:Rne/Rng family ribonuclease [Alkaliphilus serpentinus]|uniref:Rne/Rng family ribonuclease n=1 Tax=Alkaliphilus serpentinus TaxID=1482731 RepID=A0A833HQV3_9FIRM|nr:Rne/Rng family ribonuclease [Alkaliphilus serpentinus]KAB3531431.1 Rne/Rng family ribonuclease [Alkaliphilus serpentinus]
MNEIIVDVGIAETRLAILEDKDLVELYIERKNNKRIVGNIYKGRVTNVLPGMQAAFVDIGLDKNSFLYVKDALPQDLSNEETEVYKEMSIKEVLKPGQEIILQVIKEPIGTKGARVTTHITLPGRYLVLMPYTDYIGVSRRIADEGERERLRLEIEELKPHNMGIIVRTVAEGRNKEDFKDDIRFLLKLWQKIEKEKKLGFAPRLIHKDFDLVNRSIRDIFTNDISRFIINDEEEYNRARELIELSSPSLKDRLQLVEDSAEVFQEYCVEGQIGKGVSRRIWLKSGGYIVIDTTEALTVVDVNTGKYVGSVDLEDTVFRTNLEAAVEIAKQLRLRDIGGIIIVDFIDMTNEEYEKRVLKELELALEKDRTKTKIMGMTHLGLVEITRKKVRQRLESHLQKRCNHCDGTGKVLSEYSLLHKLEKHFKRTKNHTTSRAVLFEINPESLKELEGEKDIIEEMEKTTDIKAFFIENPQLTLGEIKVKMMGNQELIEGQLKEQNKKEMDDYN